MKNTTAFIVRSAFLLVSLFSLSFQSISTSAAPPPPDRNMDQVNRTIEFAGLTWGVRYGWGSPGPNEFSDSASSVWVDAQGRLHLKIRKEAGTWLAAEVFSTSRARYGPHTFYVLKENPYLNSIDPNLVFGMFLYKNGCGPDCHDELDIEISRWRHPGAYYNAQYVAQPANVTGNKHPFHLSLLGPLSTHMLNWTGDEVKYASYTGGSAAAPASLLQTWTYTGADIPSVNEDIRIIIDYWMDAGAAPANGKEDEIIIVDAAIATRCIPVKELVCGQTVRSRTDFPGGRDQVDEYAGWPWPESGPEMAYSFTAEQAGQASVLLSHNPGDQDVFVLDGAPGFCTSYQTVLAYGNEYASLEVVEDHRYYILVDSPWQRGGGYDLEVDCSGNPAPEDPVKLPVRHYLPFGPR